ncbi:hypothetical protein BH10ACT10_BH10ACT10_09630 [soil metagenome]
MRHLLIRSAGVALLATVMSVSLVSGAGATAGSDYSQHVRACSQSMGFSGTHNPGVMHHGLSGWDPTHVC